MDKQKVEKIASILQSEILRRPGLGDVYKTLSTVDREEYGYTEAMAIVAALDEIDNQDQDNG